MEASPGAHAQQVCALTACLLLRLPAGPCHWPAAQRGAAGWVGSEGQGRAGQGRAGLSLALALHVLTAPARIGGDSRQPAHPPRHAVPCCAAPQVAAFLVAGFETTAHSVSWALVSGRLAARMLHAGSPLHPAAGRSPRLEGSCVLLLVVSACAAALAATTARATTCAPPVLSVLCCACCAVRGGTQPGGAGQAGG